MCNFDNMSNGSCENCGAIDVDNGCYKAGFQSSRGTQKYVKTCTSGNMFLRKNITLVKSELKGIRWKYNVDDIIKF